MSWMVRLIGCSIVCVLTACDGRPSYSTVDDPVATAQSLTVDPTTGIPYAITFQHPISGFGTSDYGFGFGQVNNYFCLSTNAQTQCTSYGYHLGRDTQVGETPVGTDVLAPADGIVRITTDKAFGGFGSDSSSNSHYNGCVIVLEHLLRNQQAVTTLLGHLLCESGDRYDPDNRKGNPKAGTVVHRGQYLAHVAHYWHGPDQSTDWHHLHWGMRKGRFSSSANASVYVEGYAPRSEFTTDPATGALTHPDWLDPFLVVAANSDPAAQANANVRHHPSGSLLQDLQGRYWIVRGEDEIDGVSSDVMITDRYDTNGAVRVSDEEIGCYRHGADIPALGHVTLYVRPGSNTVVMAYDQSWERHDVIRWEALLSWGYDDSDLIEQASASYYESSYRDRGVRLLRPGTLVKADESSEVSIVTAEQTRLPIASGDVFEQAGFQWERVVSLPQSVLGTVAGEREGAALTLDDLHACALMPTCPGGASSCGGGGPPDSSSDSGESGGGMAPEESSSPDMSSGGRASSDPPASDRVDAMDKDDESSSDAEPLHLAYRSPVSGPVTIQGWWQDSSGSTRAWGVIPCVDGDPGDDRLECDLPVPSGSSQFEFQMYLPGPAYWGDESCDGGGCGAPLGTLTLTEGGRIVPITLIPNQSGPPYYNGRVAPVP